MRHRLDCIPVGVCLGLLAFSIWPLSWHWSWWCLPYAFVLLMLKNAALGAQHNHAHLKVFRWHGFNFVYDLLLAQLTGYSTPEWELQHARGHHRKYLNPLEDTTSPLDPKTGQNLGIWAFTWQGTLKSFPEALAVAQQDWQRGKKQSSFALWGHLFLQCGLTVLWLWLNPLMGAVFFLGSNLLCRALLWWGTYWQHINAPCTHVYDASNTTTHPLLNALVFNNGYHTAHHEQPGLHWAHLPERTRQIQARIPPQCLRSDINFHLETETLDLQLTKS